MIPHASGIIPKSQTGIKIKKRLRAQVVQHPKEEWYSSYRECDVHSISKDKIDLTVNRGSNISPIQDKLTDRVHAHLYRSGLLRILAGLWASFIGAFQFFK